MNRTTGWLAAWVLFSGACCPAVCAATKVPKQTFIEVPFEFVHGAIVVSTRVNGAGPFWMMLDTGADPSIVDIGIGRSVGLKISNQGQQGSGGGTSPSLSYETSLPIVQIGDLTATRVDALAMDLSNLSSKMERPIGGVLGYSLLKKRVVQIDYPARKVRFCTSLPSCPGGDSTSVKLAFRYADDILAKGVTVDGMPVTTNLDTGSNSYFLLTPAAVDKLGLSDDVARAHESSSVGFNGALRNREGTVRIVTVGTISVEDPPVVFYGKGMGMDKETWDLRIGSAFLKDFVVTLDFIHGQITLTRASNSHPSE